MRERAKVDPAMAEQLQEKEAQMDSIAELAKEAGTEFRGKDTSSSTDLFVEEGMIKSVDAEFHKKQERMYSSPLPLMISWGRENGVITDTEAKDLREWYKPEL